MAPQANPPSLPPTVEEAYRRKCIQLKERSKELEDENDAYRLRLHRLRRQIQKCRLERAFLLEQISKRTSTNVEDSEGSPSPPPTPQDKPLRTKRGHRKPSLLPVGAEGGNSNATFINQNLSMLSPSSDAFSHSQHDGPKDKTNGVPKMPKRPSNAFEIYCKDMRPILQSENKEKIEAKEFQVEAELARRWKDMPETEKQEYVTRYEQELQQWKEERDARKKSRGGRESTAGGRGRGGSRPRPRFEEAEVQDDEAEPEDDQDVEMGDADSDRGAAAADQDETEPEDNDDAGEKSD